MGEALGQFLALLERWAGAVDLVGRRDPEAIVREDVLAALCGVRFLPPAGRLLDVGSGNGFPAVPLLLAVPAMRGVLLEPRERRWAFLREVVRELELSAEVRRERAAEHQGGPYEVMTVRGVGESAWVGEVGRLLGPGGTLLWWTGVAAARGAAAWPGGAVLTSTQLSAGQGVLVVWRRCFT